MEDIQSNDTLSETPPPEEKRPPLMRVLFFVLETLETLAIAIFLYIGINFLTARIRVDGPSMESTFINNDYVIVFRLAYKLGDVERGDVIVFPAPRNPIQCEESYKNLFKWLIESDGCEDYIKRIIGLPGDTVEIKGGNVLVNGVVIDEPYIKMSPARDHSRIVVPQGMVYVMGDNRNNSSDSRQWGPAPIDDIIGKAVFTYWPPDNFGAVKHYDLLTP